MSEQKNTKKKRALTEDEMNEVGGGDWRGDKAGQMATEDTKLATLGGKLPWNGDLWQKRFDLYWSKIGTSKKY